MKKVKQCKPYDSRFKKYAVTELQEQVYIEYGNHGSIVNATARALGKDPSFVSRVVRTIQERAEIDLGEMEWDDELQEIVFKPLKIWLFDIETAPSEAYVWNYWNTNIGHGQVKKYGHIMSYCGKWLGDEDITYVENRGKNDKSITKKIIKYFDQADIVVGHNGRAFDVKTVTGRALVHGLKPPSPFRVVDTFLAAKKFFKLPRNSLECIASELGCTEKLKHKNFPGFDLWKACMDGDDLAWEEMKIYNIQDVQVLEEVYLKMRPWMADHPNLNPIQAEGRPICPKCASGEVKVAFNKFAHTSTGKYQLYRCSNCGGWSRGRDNRLDKEKRKPMIVNAVST